MLFDYLAGRPTEVEVRHDGSLTISCGLVAHMVSWQVILGTPLREGLRLGVPVPSLTA